MDGENEAVCLSVPSILLLTIAFVISRDEKSKDGIVHS